MATTRTWVAYGISKTAIILGADVAPTLKNLSSAAQKCGSEIDNTSNLYQYVDWELYVRFASAPAAGASVSLYLVPAIDGTNYGDGADDSVTPPATCWVGAFPVRAVNTQQRVSLAAPTAQCMIGPGKYKPVIVNSAGQAFTNTDGENILYYRLYNEQAV